MRRILLLAAVLAAGCTAPMATREAPVATQPAVPARAERTEADEYTRYELLDPDTAQFRILYEVTAIAPGAEVFFNPIRKGSEASGERVTDRMTGDALRFEVVAGEAARRTGCARLAAVIPAPNWIVSLPGKGYYKYEGGRAPIPDPTTSASTCRAPCRRTAGRCGC